MATSTEAEQFHPADEHHTSRWSVDHHNDHEAIHAEFVNSAYRRSESAHTFEEFAKEAYYARVKEVYKEIEEFARTDDDY
jgi:isocitrate lyase